jgi:DNA-binding CsgD family transcriptional regulator
VGNPSKPRQGDPLTAREIEILRLVAEGKSTAAIVAQLHLSLGTVACHLVHLSVKLGAHGRPHAVHLAHIRGILGTPPGGPGAPCGYAAIAFDEVHPVPDAAARIATRANSATRRSGAQATIAVYALTRYGVGGLRGD